MDDFASTALFNLIAVELKKQGLDASPDSQFGGKTSGSAKRDLLDLAIDQLGPAGVLRIGQGIRDIEFHPLLAVLKKSADPVDLLQRWQRLEGYYHGRHRVRQLHSDTRSLTLCHYSTGPTPPSAGEDLVIAGFLCALLQCIGVTGLSMQIDRIVVVDNGAVVANCGDISATDQWVLSWTRHTRHTTEPVPLGADTDVVGQVKALIVDDPARGWNLNTMATELHTSTRTLQRRLAACGSNFQLLLREARVECAARSLLRRGASLGETGYTCGFSDQAHFSREFKQRYNLAPSEYADLLHAESPDGDR